MTLDNLLILIIALIISISGILINLSKNNKTRTIVWQEKDNSLLYFRIAIPLVLISSLIIYLMEWVSFKTSLTGSIIGYFLVLVGLIIRWLAVIKLGKAFTVKVSIIKEHKLHTTGIYKKIRHPSYTGLLLYYFGLGILMHNFICIIILTCIPLWIVLKRISHEEKALLNHFNNEYRIYQANSWKLFPFI